MAAEPTFIFNMKKNTLTLLALISAFLANAQIVIKTNYPTASITVQRPNSLYVNGTPLASDGFLYVQWEIDSLRANWPTNGAPGTPGNGTNYVATIFTNSVLSSKQYVMLNTNPLAFNIGSIGGGYASNYVGSFSNLYSYNLVTPSLGASGLSPGTNLNEVLTVSTNGGASWFTPTTFLTNNPVLVSVFGSSNAAPGSLTLLGVDHPELIGRTNAMFGQSFAFANPVLSSDPVTLGYLNGYPVAVLANTVGLGNNFFESSTNISGTNHLYFSAFSTTSLDLSSFIQYVRIDSIGLDATKTNVLLNVAVSNYVAGSFIETTTNLAAPWTLATSSGSITNSGEITFTNPISAISVQFWRARGNPINSVSSGPVTLTSVGEKQSFYTPTNSSDVTLGNLANLIRFDTNYIYIGVNSNQWKRSSLSVF